MNIPRRQRHRGQQGQALLLALAFMAFFVLVIPAVLNMSLLDAKQYGLTESSSAYNSGAEGGAAYGAADAGRSDVKLTCAAGNSGTITMQSGDTATYRVNACNSSTSSTGGTGEDCLLCILNQVPPGSASTSVLTFNNSITTTGGNDYVNGTISASAHATLTALPSPAAGVFYLSGGSGSGCCAPAAGPFAPAITDPYASLAAPSPVAGEPAGCTSWVAASGCTESFNNDPRRGVPNTVAPGLWASLSIGGSADVTFGPGVYVFTGQLSIGGSGTIDGTSGLLLYLACAGYGTSGRTCAQLGQTSGGYLTFAGSGSASFTAGGSGPYAGIVILSDPGLQDPGGVTHCSAGSGLCLLNTNGSGAALTGTVDLRSGGVSIQGNSGETVSGGRFIANSLYIHGSGSNGFSLTGTTPIVSTSRCVVFDDGVTSSTGTSAGRALIQSQCPVGTSTVSGVLDFNYTP